MSKSCKGRCIFIRGEKIVNSLKYANGQKWCLICCSFLKTEKIFCPCCGTNLRIKPKIRNKIFK